MINLPPKYTERMKAQLGAGYGDYLAALGRDAVKGLHVNTLRCRAEEIDAAVPGLAKAPFEDNCRLVREGRPARHPYHAAGLYYMQEPSAMLPAAAACVPAGARVLDLCAAPGGKASQLAIKLGGGGLLVANEIDRARAQILRENILRMGYRNAAVTNLRPDALSGNFGGYFDVVLVDAPCSGEGMMRKEEQAAQNWSEANVRACAARQREIVKSADACLKEGGLLVYSTCTFAEEEDEETVRFALGLGYEITEPPSSIAALGVDTGYGYKYYPHLFAGEGQFFCLLRKLSPASPASGPAKAYARAGRAELALLGETLDIGGLTVARRGDLLFVPALDRELPCLVNGVMLGKAEKGRFTPSHQLFTALSDRCLRRVELTPDDERVGRYLAGEEIAGDARGWCAVLAGGHALGGGKGSNGTVKNHYPKNLRQSI